MAGDGSSGASVGISFFPEDGDDAGMLLDRAEAALEQARRPPSAHRIGRLLGRALR